MIHKNRLQRLQQSMAAQKLDLLLVTHLANVRYLCRFTGSAGALLVSNKGVHLFTDGRYTTQAREEVKAARVVIAKKAPLLAAGEWISSHRKAARGLTIGIEGDHMTVAERVRFHETLPAEARIRAVSPLVEPLRLVKDRDEIDLLRAAVLMGAGLFEVALKSIRPGVRELEVAAEMEYAARRAGADAMSFETIIASGERSALPHGRASQAVIPADGFVVCDFGVILSGYCSDMTRTVYVGRPSLEAREFYGAVKAAQLAAVAAVAPGVSTGDIDQAARKVLQKKGLGRFFTHSTGHGVGLEIHEAPRVAAGQKDILQPGMIITVEPGAYISGRWGVRIEDMLVVTESGCEVLTPTSKDLIALDS